MLEDRKTPRLIFAPMATLSHQAMRQLIFRFGGCDEYYSEMIHASSLLTNKSFEKYYTLTGPEPEKMVWQLTDTESEPIIEAAKIVRSLGGKGIDINMGCPAPDIYRYGAGMAWMNKPLAKTSAMLGKIAGILANGEGSSTSQNGSVGNTCSRLSVKCRLGEDDFTEENFFSFIDMLVSSGVTQIVLHPRTRRQKYSRPANWNYVQKLCDYCKKNFPQNNVSIIGNGDIDSVEAAKNSLAVAPDADGIMLARFAVQKPWLFKQISDEFSNTHAEKQKIDLYEIAENFLSDLQKFQPKEFWKTRSQRFFAYFCDNFSFSHFLKTQMLNAPDQERQLQILSEYFSKMESERYVVV